MRILVIGSGGREHAQTWALAQSPQVKQLFSATTNAGIQRLTTPANIDAGNPAAVADFAAQEKLDLVVVGAEKLQNKKGTEMVPPKLSVVAARKS